VRDSPDSLNFILKSYNYIYKLFILKMDFTHLEMMEFINLILYVIIFIFKFVYFRFIAISGHSV